MELKRQDIQQITRGRMVRFVKDHLLPCFPAEWGVYQGEQLYRTKDVLMQSVMINRSRHQPKFDVSYAINLPALTDIPDVANLGSPLLAEPRGLLRRQQGVLWFEWSDNLPALADAVLSELHRQMRPSAEAPLSLAEAADYVETYRLSSGHYFNYWALGVIKGLLEQWGDASKYLDAAQDDLMRRLKRVERDGKPGPDWIHDDIGRIDEYKRRCENIAEFRAFCESKSAETLREWGMV